MPVSMTGFGRSEFSDEKYRILVEIKTVNNRYFDFVIRMPKELNALEQRIRQVVSKYIIRGRAEVYIQYYHTAEEAYEVRINKALALAYQNSLDELADTLELKESMRLGHVLNLPDVISVQNQMESPDIIWQNLEPYLIKALSDLKIMRQNEGQHLKEDILFRITEIERLHGQIEQRAPELAKLEEQRLKERISELMDNLQLDENRLLMEVAIMANRSDITEELVRLEGHINELKKLLDKEDESIGRKLDFLLQELNREINTIGSKSNDLEISNQVVEIKSELEKIREQVQNIE